MVAMINIKDGWKVNVFKVASVLFISIPISAYTAHITATKTAQKIVDDMADARSKSDRQRAEILKRIKRIESLSLEIAKRQGVALDTVLYKDPADQ